MTTEQYLDSSLQDYLKVLKTTVQEVMPAAKIWASHAGRDTLIIQDKNVKEYTVRYNSRDNSYNLMLSWTGDSTAKRQIQGSAYVVAEDIKRQFVYLDHSYQERLEIFLKELEQCCAIVNQLKLKDFYFIPFISGRGRNYTDLGLSIVAHEPKHPDSTVPLYRQDYAEITEDENGCTSWVQGNLFYALDTSLDKEAISEGYKYSVINWRVEQERDMYDCADFSFKKSFVDDFLLSQKFFRTLTKDTPMSGDILKQAHNSYLRASALNKLNIPVPEVMDTEIELA